jgi:hypothetical protein
MRNAFCSSMKKTYLIAILSIMLLPVCMQAGEPKQKDNVNEKYDVESVEITGKDAEKVSKKLCDEAQALVGHKYSEKAAKDIAQRMRKQLGVHHEVTPKVEKGTKPETVKVLFQIEKGYSFSIEADWRDDTITYHSQEGFSGNIQFTVTPDIFGAFTYSRAASAEYLLERYNGHTFGYKLQVDQVHLKLDLETYRESFNAATQTALTKRPDVPGIDIARQNFSPSISVDASKSLTMSAGLSFQRLQMPNPTLHTETDYAGTATVQYHPKLAPIAGFDRTFSASYDLRTATRILDSDFVYTRHYMSASYSFSKKTNTFSAAFLYGLTAGTPSLFGRFQMGNSYCLRGWNKFDVAPLGGTSVVQGSLGYSYKPFRVFYDVGSVWDSKQSSGVKHSLGFGCDSKYLPFISLAFPVRSHHVEPVLIISGFGSGHFVAGQFP